VTRGDRPLPTPPRSRFAEEAREERDAASPLTADRMAQAAAAGQLQEFLQHEIPEGEHARSLAMMMMGLSGLMPADAAAGPLGSARPPAPTPPPAGEQAAVPEVSPEVVAAVQQADVAGLASLLRAEHARRAPRGAAPDEAPAAPEAPAGPAAPPPAPARPGIDPAIIDELIRIAAANDVTVDWLLLRAVRRYVEEHRATGRL
jgi:hypothetical protein